MNRNRRSGVLCSSSPWSVFLFVKNLTAFSLIALLLSLTGCGESTPTRDLPSVFSISGTVTAAASNAVDSDTNDPLASFVSNDTAAEAQSLSNPVTLGGYLTFTPTGVSGDSFASTSDFEDWYLLTLTAGQTLTLTIADHDGDATNAANPDFDLYLYDPADTTFAAYIHSSVGLGSQEIISVLVGGDYKVLVNTLGGASNYTLSVSPVQTATATLSLRIEDEFVPNEIILRFKNSSAATTQGFRSTVTPTGMVHLAGDHGDPMLYRMANSSGSAQPQAVQPLTQTASALQDAKRATIAQVKSLRKRADVLSADLNYIRRPLLVLNDSLYPDQWNLPMINLSTALDDTTGSAGVVVAVLDTGIMPSHPDLAGRLCVDADGCAGYDFVDNDTDPSDPGVVSSSNGILFHGTHVAGILGAVGNNAVGVVGIDWNAKIMPVRVFGAGFGTSYAIVQGLRYAAGLSNDSGTILTNTADIFNLSFGGTGYSQVEQDLFNQLHAAGIFSFAAAGNDATNLPFYPAAYAGVVSVSAVDKDKNLASYSSYGLTIDVTAPGGESETPATVGIVDGIISTSGLDPTTYIYEPHFGTSMAVPHLAGVAALMLAVDPAMTPAEFDAVLAGGRLTEDLNLDGPARRNDFFGYGLIDAQKAVTAALDLAGGAGLPPTLSYSSGLLNFGTDTDTLPLVLGNSGGGPLTVTDLSTSAAWITLDASAVPTGGLGTYSVLVDRIGLSPGTYAETLIITTAEADIYTLDLLVQVGASQAATVGRQTISLHEAVSDTLLESLSVDPVSGAYRFNFAFLEPGSYLVKTSSDLDHDGQNCDSGEACLTSGVINLTNQNTTINLSSGFGQ